MFSLFNRLKIGRTTGLDIVEELVDKQIIRVSTSREKPLKIFKKQLLKKEFKEYIIEPKLYFSKPFFRFWYFCVEPTKSSNSNYNIEKAINIYKEYGYKLSSLVFEHLSIELLKKYYEDSDTLVEFGSYWDRFSEFDIYCKSKSGKYILGECKYKSRPITKSELIKLRQKAELSGLSVYKYALFSKSGFSQEFYKNLDKDTLIFTLEDFSRLY